MCPDTPTMVRSQRGSSILIALFVIVIMALLAAAMGRFLVDSSEKHTVEVRGVRALMAAQSGLEVALYRLYPNGEWQGQASRCVPIALDFTEPGLAGCQASITCNRVTVSAAGGTQTGYRFSSEGRCGQPDAGSGPNPDFAVSRTLVAEAFDGVNP
ncbi:MSHA biogenesis protein MshP [Aeromonas caviae]|uniref:MSHA biogenesis protein MshP n=1 Tax=Aeromonas caviae TaxID=648 RepID=UPI0029DA65A0|nr:MSHA biogenesis protein MshP [Aeromonas caviae]MDX7857416.1 MSHA biogenesis protein MshP [Aeromonas caviae]